MRMREMAEEMSERDGHEEKAVDVSKVGRPL